MKKQSTLLIRVSFEDKQKIKEIAGKLDISASELIRRRVLGKRLPEKGNYQAARKLSALIKKADKLPVNDDDIKTAFLVDIAEILKMMETKNAGKDQ